MIGRTLEGSLAGLVSIAKTGLLYADDMTVASAAALTAESYSRAPEWTRDEILDLTAGFVFERGFRAATAFTGTEYRDDLDEVASALVLNGRVPDLDNEQWMWAIRRYHGESLPSDLVLEAEILHEFRDRKLGEELARQAHWGLQELSVAEDSGLVLVKRMPMPLLASPDRLKDVFQLLAETVSGEAFLALDRHTAGCVGAFEADLARRQSFMRFGGALLDKLPGFEVATMSEVLQLRSEVADSLAGLRARVLEFSASVTCDLDDQDFRIEVENEYARSVAPQVAELRRDLRDNRFVKVLTERALSGGKLTRMGVEAVAALGIGAVSKPAAFGAAVTAAVETTELVLGSASDVAARAASLRQNPVFLFVAAEEQARRRR